MGKVNELQITRLKSNMKELVSELNDRIKYMDNSNINSIIRLSAWINKDANRIRRLKFFEDASKIKKRWKATYK